MEKKVLGQLLILFGVLLIAGGVLFLFEKPISFFGKLPGDIRIERENFSIYIPITSMIIISLILTLLLNIISRFFR
ncbi:MAG: DUF2905 domain-containing protein [Acidobacteria bacterium]|nr:DUF2905 domain-containing protein [Acidobacteriota bacterium]